VHGNSINGADLIAEAATFAGDGINRVVLYCLKAAEFLTKSTLGALLFVNKGYLSAPKLVFFLDLRLEEEVKVGSVDVGVN
jgi:hypothetical protein